MKSLTKTLKQQIESLTFELTTKRKNGLYFAFSKMYGGILIDGKTYNEILLNIEIYLKDRHFGKNNY
jgi:hypothetical protein